MNVHTIKSNRIMICYINKKKENNITCLCDSVKFLSETLILDNLKKNNLMKN